MIDNSQCPGDDTLPLGIRQPDEREIERAKRTMRHAFVSAPPATGQIYGIDVCHLSETDKALAFNWLWMMLQSHGIRATEDYHVRPI